MSARFLSDLLSRTDFRKCNLARQTELKRDIYPICIVHSKILENYTVK